MQTNDGYAHYGRGQLLVRPAPLVGARSEGRNKPAPDVYLGPARRLGVSPADCVAFEDSGSGRLSARAAGMRTVAVPAGFERDDPKFDLATLKLPSLTAFDSAVFQRLNP